MIEHRVLAHANGNLVLDHCLVMGIVNRTPDSFYDGGRMELPAARDYGLRLIDEGADILDLGAVKAGPGEPVDVSEETRRLLPLIESLTDSGVPLSVETSRAAVARDAIEAGAVLVNDVTGLGDPEMAGVCEATGAGLVLMHHGGQLRGRPRHPRYADVVTSVIDEWRSLADKAGAAGVRSDQIIVDPGLDFGKNTFHSLELMARLDDLVEQPWPVLVAPSRKDVVGETLGLPLDQRLEGTLALIALAVTKGASIVRVHDVKAATRTVRMVEAVDGRRLPASALRGLWD
jgi:dihydropteroate synthase